MDIEINRLLNGAKRSKRILLVGGVLLLAISGVVLVGGGILAYKSVTYTAEKVKTWKTEGELPFATVPERGFVEEVVLGVASSWLEQGLASTEVRTLKDGLSCFDALGGPSALDIVAYVKSRTADQNLIAQLSGLSEKLEASASPTSGPAACATWITNS